MPIALQTRLTNASNQQKSAGKLLQEHNTLPSVTSSEENKNGSRGNGGAERGSFGGLAALLGFGDIFSRVEAGGLGGRNETLSTVLFATNGLLNGLGLGLGSRGSRLFEPLEQATLSVDLGAGETPDSGNEFFASGHSSDEGQHAIDDKRGAGDVPCGLEVVEADAYNLVQVWIWCRSVA